MRHNSVILAVRSRILNVPVSRNAEGCYPPYLINEDERSYYQTKKKGDRVVRHHIASFHEDGTMFGTCRACGRDKVPMMEFEPKHSKPTTRGEKIENYKKNVNSASMLFTRAVSVGATSHRWKMCNLMFRAQSEIGKHRTSRCMRCTESRSAPVQRGIRRGKRAHADGRG